MDDFWIVFYMVAVVSGLIYDLGFVVALMYVIHYLRRITEKLEQTEHDV